MAKQNKYPRDASTPAEQSAEASAESDRVTSTSAEGEQPETTSAEGQAATLAAKANEATEVASEPESEKTFDPEARSACPECTSSWSEVAGCANVECARNLDFIAAANAKAERDARLVDVVAKARACKLCSATRPCSPEHYEAMGYVIPDERFLELFGAPLRLAESDVRTGSVKCRVIERVMVGHRIHDAGEEGVFAASEVDSAPHCFEEIR